MRSDEIGSNQNEISSDRILGAAVVTWLSRVMHRYPERVGCCVPGVWHVLLVLAGRRRTNPSLPCLVVRLGVGGGRHG